MLFFVYICIAFVVFLYVAKIQKVSNIGNDNFQYY